MHMPIQGEQSAFRRFLRRWGLLFSAIALLALLSALDHGLKHAGDGLGFHPNNASCIVTSADFPSFCGALAATDAADRFTAETPRPFDAFELAVRKATGVRPTPLRWRVWLGPRMVWSRWNGTYGLCVHPGLLMRAVCVYDTLKGEPTGSNGLSDWAGFHYAWRDGFLILSPSATYIEAALEGPLVDKKQETSPRELALRWDQNEIRVSPEPRIPIHGTLYIATQTSETPLRLSGRWPDDSLFSLTTHHPEDTLALWRMIHEPLKTMADYNRLSALASSVWKQWRLAPPSEDWKTHVEEFSIALMALDTTETIPIPEWGVMMRTPNVDQILEHPWAPAIATLSPIEYAWEGHTGLLATLLGEKAAICLAQDGDRWLAASRRDRMSELLDIPQPNLDVEADMQLEINWEATGRTAEILLRKAGEHELIPEMNAQEVDTYLGKYARSLARMGRLRISGKANDGRLVFSGTLVSPEEEGNNTP